MDSSQAYILIGIVALAIIAVLLFFVRGRSPGQKMSKLAQLSFVFILAGILFSESRFIGYGLMTIGGLLALVDIIRKLSKK